MSLVFTGMKLYSVAASLSVTGIYIFWRGGGGGWREELPGYEIVYLPIITTFTAEYTVSNGGVIKE
jgi:hypothetical protein